MITDLKEKVFPSQDIKALGVEHNQVTIQIY